MASRLLSLHRLKRCCGEDATGPTISARLSRYLCSTRNLIYMHEAHEKLQDLYNRIPRRHTADNVKEIYNILDDYEDVLKSMESDERIGAGVAPLFEPLDSIRATVKNSNSPKASKKVKDTLFDEASGALKDEIAAAMKL